MCDFVVLIFVLLFILSAATVLMRCNIKIFGGTPNFTEDMRSKTPFNENSFDLRGILTSGKKVLNPRSIKKTKWFQSEVDKTERELDNDPNNDPEFTNDWAAKELVQSKLRGIKNVLSKKKADYTNSLDDLDSGYGHFPSKQASDQFSTGMAVNKAKNKFQNLMHREDRTQ